MPIKNTVKSYAAPAYYHVYNHRAGDAKLFHDAQDYQTFVSLFARYLDPDDTATRADGRPYEKYDIDLAAYCLMGNHFHLLLFQQHEPQAITQLMRSLSTAYTMYYNKKYGKSGHLFESAFKASLITEEPYLAHITRYIHMNPRSYLRYKWSSLGVYLGAPAPNWLRCDSVKPTSPATYRAFLQSYESKKTERDLLKHQLAHM